MKIIYENSKTKIYGLTSYGESIVNIIKNIRNLKEKGSYKEKTLKMLKRIIVYEKMRNK